MSSRQAMASYLKGPISQIPGRTWSVSHNTPFGTEMCPWRYFQMHFYEWKILYFIKISLKFVPKDPINNNPALV